VKQTEFGARTFDGSTNVGGVMHRRFIALAPSETLGEAEQLMRMARVRAVPVALEGVLVGVLSYRTLVEWLLGRSVHAVVGRASRWETRVEAVMEESPSRLTPGARLDEAAARLVDRDDGCVPVVEELSERLVGVLTEMDLLRAAYEPRPFEGVIS
jgi:CBS domain-containing protein